MTLSGRVVGPNETPIENADIWFFTDKPGMAPASSDSNGRFEISALDTEYIVVGRKGSWFTKETISAETTQHTFHLDSELLFEPTIARTDEYGSPIGLVSLWRYVGPSPHTDQVFYIEITNLTESDPQLGISHWDIEGKIGFSGGLFTLTFPEDDVVVDYGSVATEVTLEDYAPAYDHFAGPVKTVGVNAKNRNEDKYPLVDFHPLRPDRPSLPAYVLTSHIGWDEGQWDPETTGFQTLSTMEAQNEKIKDQGIRRILDALPVVGEMASAVGLLEWAFERSPAQGSIGEDIDPQNPNVMDTVSKPWQSDNPRGRGEDSVTVRIPVLFKNGGSETSLIVQAEWAGAGIRSTEGYFGKQISANTEAFTIGEDQDKASTSQPTTEPGYEISNQKMCTEVVVLTSLLDSTLGCYPSEDNRAGFITDDGTYLFSTSDRNVVSWIEFENVSEHLTVTWDWFTPNGLHYSHHRKSVSVQDYHASEDDPTIITVSLPLKNSKPATLPGEWRVEVSIDTVDKSDEIVQEFVIGE